MAVALRFIVDGRPVPKARPRRGRGGHFYTPQRTREYEQTVGAMAVLARNGRPGRPWPLNRTYAVGVKAYLGPGTRMDIDNVLKTALDGCRGILWDDDRQVRRQSVQRVDVDSRYAERLDMTVVIEGGGRE